MDDGKRKSLKLKWKVKKYFLPMILEVMFADLDRMFQHNRDPFVGRLDHLWGGIMVSLLK